MSNRADRRRKARAQTNRNAALIAGYTRQQRIAGLIQNGITEKDLADEYDVEYLDFNEYPEEILSLNFEDFMDVDHLNGNGAKKVTMCLANYILEKSN